MDARVPITNARPTELGRGSLHMSGGNLPESRSRAENWTQQYRIYLFMPKQRGYKRKEIIEPEIYGYEEPFLTYAQHTKRSGDSVS
ncbi:hypothetical protein PoB_002547500 [Plakobranchus ocellatus]|uniref:Uncharacterized protein n=1 Tax=Plakobranchus ocellatus TaxID=259542 RepID=A0AAV3ZUX7_9GAST|nr:hypothetical protein PoB_002547500 [Plakobranchus ocellatus]